VWIDPGEVWIDPSEVWTDSGEVWIDPGEVWTHPGEVWIDPCEVWIDPGEVWIDPDEMWIDSPWCWTRRCYPPRCPQPPGRKAERRSLGWASPPGLPAPAYPSHAPAACSLLFQRHRPSLPGHRIQTQRFPRISRVCMLGFHFGGRGEPNFPSCPARWLAQ